MNERIQKMRKKLIDQKPRVCSERCRIFTESMKKDSGLPNVVARANAFYRVLDQMSLYVNEDELIVGNMAKWPKASPIFPEYSNQWLLDEMDGKPYLWEERPGDKFYADEDVRAEIRECVDYWKDKALFDKVRATISDEANAAWDAGIIDETWVCGAGLGNEIVDYNLVVTKGLKDVIARIDAKMKDLDPLDPDTTKKMFFLRSARKGNEAVINYANRISELCSQQAEACSNRNRMRS